MLESIPDQELTKLTAGYVVGSQETRTLKLKRAAGMRVLEHLTVSLCG